MKIDKNPFNEFVVPNDMYQYLLANSGLSNNDIKSLPATSRLMRKLSTFEMMRRTKPNHRGRTLMHYAADNKLVDLAQNILERCTGDVQRKDLVNLQAQSGNTALMLAAAKRSNQEMVLLFLDAGTDVNLTRKNGESALDDAYSSQN